MHAPNTPHRVYHSAHHGRATSNPYCPEDWSAKKLTPGHKQTVNIAKATGHQYLSAPGITHETPPQIASHMPTFVSTFTVVVKSSAKNRDADQTMASTANAITDQKNFPKSLSKLFPNLFTDSAHQAHGSVNKAHRVRNKAVKPPPSVSAQ
jgi:hypothetical protein